MSFAPLPLVWGWRLPYAKTPSVALAEDGSAIDEFNFPDVNFRAYLKEFDTIDDGTEESPFTSDVETSGCVADASQPLYILLAVTLCAIPLWKIKRKH